ncbi:MAG TPA: ABC transporter permease, partial [Chloroflexota bacterium]|nr:ABC transporter permease [Chloroflexota bacterium]
MSAFILRRVLQAIPTLFGITLVSFGLMRLAPGDPVSLLVFGASDFNPADLALIRQAYGLDQPLPVQYVSWVGHLLTGDFGRSFIYKRPVLDMIGATLPNTLQLASIALVVALS